LPGRQKSKNPVFHFSLSAPVKTIGFVHFREKKNLLFRVFSFT
jgi:hypothetical protein